MSSKKAKRMKMDSALLLDERLILICDWTMCRALYEDMEQFYEHVAEHANQVDLKSRETDCSMLCLWEDCGFETVDFREMARHLYYHAYHTKTKCLGANLIEKNALQGCQLDPHTRNAISEVADPFICMWSDCNVEFLNVQQYYWHVHGHSEEGSPHPGKSTGKGGLKCLWNGCESSFQTKFKLRDHLRKHTQERPIACPTCGSLFASRTKLHDHCLRQLPLDANEFRCSECSKLLPTERLLREHMRYHRAQFECQHCPKNKNGEGRHFSNAHALASHITYCHGDSRPYSCPETSCNYSAKTQTDLSKHMETHVNSLWYCCEVAGCEFTARTTTTLQRHVRKVHEGITYPLYECHECQQRFQCSNTLKKHLGTTHQLFPSPGGRFRYQQGEDGIFRVEVSIETQYRTVEEGEAILPS